LKSPAVSAASPWNARANGRFAQPAPGSERKYIKGKKDKRLPRRTGKAETLSACRLIINREFLGGIEVKWPE